MRRKLFAILAAEIKHLTCVCVILFMSIQQRKKSNRMNLHALEQNSAALKNSDFLTRGGNKRSETRKTRKGEKKNVGFHTYTLA